MAFDHVIILCPGFVELLAGFRRGAAFLTNELGTRYFRCLAETGGHTDRIDLIDEIADGWV